MGGGENEITISAVLDAIGFEKGSKKLQGAINSLSKTAKNLGNQMKGFGTQTKRSFDVALGSIRRFMPTLIGVSSVYGILSKAVNAYMSENQKLAAQMNSIWTALGNVLGPIINQIINWVTTAVSYFLEFLRLLGVTSKTASQLSKTAKGAGGDLKKTLAGFDELNLLNGNGGGGGANGQLSDVDPADWMKEIIELLKNKMWDQATDLIIEKMNSMIAAFRQKAAELGTTVGEWLDDVLHMVARIVNEVDWSGIGSGIGEFLVNAFKDVNGEDIGAILVAKITIGFRILTGFLSTSNLGSTVGRILSETIVGAINSIANAIEKADWQAIGKNIRAFFANIKWEDIRDAIYGLLEAAWNGALDLLRGLMGVEDGEDLPIIDAFERLGKSVQKLWNELEPIADKILGFFGDFIKELVDKDLPNIINGVSVAIDSLTASFRLLGIACGGLLKVLSGDMTLSEYMASLNDEMERAARESAEAADKIDDSGRAMETLARGTQVVIGPNGMPMVVDIIGDVKSETEEASDGIRSAMSGIADSVTDAANQMESGASRASESVSGMGNSAVNTATKTRNSVPKSFEDIKTRVSNSVKTMWNVVKDNYTNMSSTSLSVSQNMSTSIGDAFDELKEKISESVSLAKQNVVDAYTDMNLRSLEVSEEMRESIAEKFSDLKDRVITSVKNVAQNVKENFSQASTDGSQQTGQMKNNIAAGFTDIRERVRDSMTAVGNAVRQNFNDARTAAVAAAGVMKSNVIDSFNNIKQSIQNSVSTMLNSVRSAFNSMNTAIGQVVSGISGKMATLRNTISSAVSSVYTTFNTLVSNAWRWGSDLLQNFINGITTKIYGLVNTLLNIGNTITNYIGFSEPDKGPLSNFHTFAPDMMDLFTRGIEQNEGKVLSAVGNLAGGISDAMQNEDFAIGPISVSDIDYSMNGFADRIVDGFETMLDRLQAIADNVTFTMPAIAGGSILPYGINDELVGWSQDGNASAMLSAIGELRDLISNFQNSVENMQWVAQFGDIRALVEQITTVQNQIKRQGGR